MDYDILDIDANVLVKTGAKIERLIDVMARPEEFYLWAVIWYVKSTEGLHHQNGISFHCKHSDATEYKAKNLSPIQAASKCQLVPVSEWLYNTVLAQGSYWTELQYLSQAKNYEGPTIN